MPEYQSAQIAAHMQATGTDHQPVQHNYGPLFTANRKFRCDRIILFRRVIAKYEQWTASFCSAQFNQCIRGRVDRWGLAVAPTIGNLHHTRPREVREALRDGSIRHRHSFNGQHLGSKRVDTGE